MPSRANVPAAAPVPAVASSRWILMAAVATAALIALHAPLRAQAAEQQAPSGGPKSLLPDDIAEPPPPPSGAVEAPVSMTPGTAPAPLPGFDPLPAAEAVLPEVPEPEPKDPLAELAGPTMAPERAGLLTQSEGGTRADLFAGSDARFLSALLARIDAPLASRWGQILLQRALLSAADAPQPVNPADWVAARAGALVRLGAGTDAHRLVSRIAIDRYTAPLYGAAAQAAVAAGDPMALCPLSPLARVLTESPTWSLADAMCLSILGDDVGASLLFDRLRRSRDLSAFDIGLAERVASATGGSRRGANPEWVEAGGLTAWRIGLASAAGLEIPADLLAAASPAARAWYVRLPGQSLESRAGLAPAVAATGAISTDELMRRGAGRQGPGGRRRRGGRALVACDGRRVRSRARGRLGPSRPGVGARPPRVRSVRRLGRNRAGAPRAAAGGRAPGAGPRLCRARDRKPRQ